MRGYRGYGGYGGLSVDDIRRSQERITQLQAFLNERAAWAGEHAITPDGIWFPQTEGLYYRILSYEGFTGEVFDGMWREMAGAFGIAEITAKAWEWAIMVARQREGRYVVAPPRLTGGTPRVLDPSEVPLPPGGEEPPPEKKSALPWVLGIGAGVLGLVGIIALSRS